MKFTIIMAILFALQACGTEIEAAPDVVDFEKRPTENVEETKLSKELPDSEDEETSDDDSEREDRVDPSDFIRISVSNLKNEFGQICYSISGPVAQFPPKKEEALDSQCVNITGTTTEFLIEKVVFGNEYAISIFHDENFNGDLDTKKFLGLKVPKEGFGFSKKSRYSNDWI